MKFSNSVDMRRYAAMKWAGPSSTGPLGTQIARFLGDALWVAAKAAKLPNISVSPMTNVVGAVLVSSGGEEEEDATIQAVFDYKRGVLEISTYEGYMGHNPNEQTLPLSKVMQASSDQLGKMISRLL
jgi:hypothetical protein